MIEHRLSIDGEIPRQLSEADEDISKVLLTVTETVIGSACIFTFISSAFFKTGLD